MLALGFAHWEFWELYNPANGYYGGQKVVFDGPNRLILIANDVTEIDVRVDIYSNWKEWVSGDHHNNAAFPQALSAIGGDPITATSNVGITYFLENGWRIKMWEGSHQLVVDGNIFTREPGADPYIEPDGQYKVTILSTRSNLVDLITPESSLSSGDVTTISANVWAYSPDVLGTTVPNVINTINQTTANIASDVWEETLSTHTTSGTYGKEVATKTDIAASTSTSNTTAANASIVTGTLTSGTYTDTYVRDNNFWVINEDVTNGITVEFIFNIPDNDRAGTFNVFGHYDGKGSSHYMQLWAWNVESAAWELMHDVFMGNKTDDEEQTHLYSEQHIDRASNNEVKMRLVHNVTTYSATHTLSIDQVFVTSVEVITASEVATAVWSSTRAEWSGLTAANIVAQINTTTGNIEVLSQEIKVIANNTLAVSL